MTYGDREFGPATKADAAYLELRTQILQGTLKPGGRIDYAVLSASFGLSITPLREALRRLEADHLVIRNAHRDVVVASLSRAEAQELHTVRQQLDLLGARLAAEHMTPTEIAAARHLVAHQDEAEALRYLQTADLPVTAGGHINIGRAFYRMVYCGSHNQVLIQYRDSISARAERYAIQTQRVTQVSAGAHRALQDELLSAIESRQASEAEALMQAHYRDLDLNYAAILFGAAAT